jgi:hypothetical protein
MLSLSSALRSAPAFLEKVWPVYKSALSGGEEVYLGEAVEG